jgi:ADP-heptose:LPS heptosyltransferase
VDLRGKTSLRECAALLTNAAVFVGLEGGLMHLARSVDRRSVIIYTGYTRPEDTGYPENRNLRDARAGEGCWSRGACEHCRASAEAVGSDEVLGATIEMLREEGR